MTAVRLGVRMRLHGGMADEYARRHAELWPEMVSLLLEHGVIDYHIYLDESDGSLFAAVVVEDLDRWEAIADTAVCRRWWHFMAPLMDVDELDRPTSKALRPVFRFPEA